VYAPDSYGVALVLMLASMVAWGSWPNLLKKLPGWRLEYFYVDYTAGFLLTALVLGLTLGSTGEPGQRGFLDALAQSGAREIAFAVVGGFIWNLGNILLLNAIMIAGLAVAFPIAAIPALVLGIGASYWLQPIGNPAFLATSALLLLAAAQVTAAAYRRLGDAPAASRVRGIAIALVSGFLIGFFPPFVTAAITGAAPLDAYAVSLFFVIGATVATAIAMPLLVKKPLIGERGRMGGYLAGTATQHVLGLLAGAIWCTGTVFNFISGGQVGLAISVGIGSGAPMVGALWGIFAWGEFSGSSVAARRWITAALLLYGAGVVVMSLAYLF
jgi:glucose uptake protein